jgi:hypothetical protein
MQQSHQKMVSCAWYMSVQIQVLVHESQKIISHPDLGRIVLIALHCQNHVSTIGHLFSKRY